MSPPQLAPTSQHTVPDGPCESSLGSTAPPPSPTTPFHNLQVEDGGTGDSEWSQLDVQHLLDKYGGFGSKRASTEGGGSVKRIFTPPPVQEPPLQVRGGSQCTLHTEYGLRPPSCVAVATSYAGASSLLRSGVADDVSSNAVATPFGIGTLVASRPGGVRTVQFGWGLAHLAPGCVSQSRCTVLDKHLDVLDGLFATIGCITTASWVSRW